MSEHFNQLAIALQERYQLKAELGRGGMATVYLAQDLQHGRRVAIKVLHPELAGAVGHDRFLREIRIASDLSHPHILPLLDSGSAVSGNSTLPFYVMPFVEGESLRVKLQREGLLPIEEAMKIAHDVATALGYAHARGVVHRDIKPENILLTGDEAVVADFGIARAIDRAAEGEVITSAGLAVGTPTYMSPEQGAGHHEVDGRSDIYSLGCVLYEMLGGDPPFSGPSPNAIAARHRVDTVPPLRTIRPSVPPSLEAVVLRSLEKVPADRFKTAEQFAAAIGQQHTPSDRTPPEHVGVQTPASVGARTVETPRPRWPIDRRTRRTALGVALATVFLVVAWWAVSEARWFDWEERYSDSPEWSAWRGWSGEVFPLFAMSDSFLVMTVAQGTQAHVFDGHRWTALAIPDSFELVRYVGRIANGRLLAAKSVRDSAGRLVRQYWWMEVSPTALRPSQSLTGDFPDDGTRPNWWSDGRNLVLWLEAIRRYDSNGWIREAIGVTGGFARVWGMDMSHRFAIPSSGESLLAFDGISWNPVPVSSGESAGRLVYQTGATFQDGATVVLGDECLDDERCRPFLLQQDTTGRPWRRVSIPDAIGIPRIFTADTGSLCDPSQFAFNDIFGRSGKDYVVSGSWSTCEPGLEKRGASGCPPRQPCTWGMRRGRLEPLADLIGKIVQAVGYMDTSAFALLDDGTLWRLIEGHWRPVTQVGELPSRNVGASPRMVVRMEAGDIRYEPGQADDESRFAVIRMDSIPESISRGVPPRDMVVRDTSAALLSAQGEVFLSHCRMDRVADVRTGTPRGALRCSPWRQLLVPAGEVRAIAFLPDGRLIGVGSRGLALTWHDRSPVPETLPPSAANETLWGLAISSDGRAMAITPTQILQRDSAGGWTTARQIRTAESPDARFLALPDGDFVVVETSMQVWDHTRDSIPVAVLYRPGFGEAVGALHALPDGRLIAGLTHSEEPLVGGRLLVWAAPVRANRSQQVQLPLSVDITDLSDDGRFLHVAGRGGSMKISLDSLPFPPMLH
jgi:tRNA A-37 threonylcarbamoyl transferase component Bud32